jgi:hypothetical protein
MPWDKRPSHVPLDADECATALYLTEGELIPAAAKLKCEPLKLVRAIARSPRLQRLQAELASLLNDKVWREYRNAFDSEDDRRREWAASKVSNTRQFQSHPLAPANAMAALPGPSASATRIIISWDDGSDGSEAPLIEHDPSAV